jgi:hypothetical protein
VNTILGTLSRALLTCVLMLALAGVTTSLAQEVATPAADQSRESLAFEFYPTESGWGSYFNSTIDEGASAELTVTIANVGDVTQDIRAYVTNAFTAPGGGFASAEYGTELNEVSQWLDFPEETFTLETGEGIERTFSVAVPEGTEPGQYITAIAGEHADASAIEGQPNLSQRLRYVVPVFITVPGETEAGFQVGGIDLDSEADALVIRIQLQNTGDMRVRPEGTVELHGESGELLVSIPVAMESIYAREETELTLGVPQEIASGKYDVTVELTDPDTGETASGEAQDLEVIAAPGGVEAVFQIVSGAVIPGPDIENVQFVTVDAVIRNTGDPVGNAQLSLVASLDNEEIERFPISQSLSLPNGETEVSARYIPATGWTSGTWSFELLLETVEPGGAAVVQAIFDVPETLEIE